MAQPTLETVQSNVGTAGALWLVETVGANKIPASLMAYSTGDGTINIVTNSGTEGLPVKIDSGVVTSVTTVATVTSLEQLAGTAIEMDTGVRTAGCQRVTIATNDLVPVSVASLPLPSLASTAALQLPDGHNVTIDNGAVGAAVNIQDGGNSITVDSADLVTIAGAVAGGQMQCDLLSANVTNLGSFNVQITSGALTALQLIDDTVVAQGTALGTTKNSMVGGSVTTSAPTYTTGQINPLSLDTSGALRVTGGGGGQEYVVNDVVPTNPTGTVAVMERDDQLSAVTEAAGDWTNARATNQGELWVALADASGDPIRSFGGGTQYTLGTDTYTEATTIGTMASVVRKDAGGTLVSLDNEVTALQVDASGNLRVTGGGGGTEYTEDITAAADPVGTALILVREDARAGGLTTTDGDNVAWRGNNRGEAYIIDTDANVSLTSIDGNITACNTGAVVISSGTLTAVTTVATVTSLDQMAGTSISMGTGVRDPGTQRVTIATNDVVPISGNLTTVATVTSLDQMAGTAIEMGTGVRTAGTQRVTIATNDVVPVVGTITASNTAGDTLHDVADAGNPVKIGGRARKEDSAAVAADDRVDAYFDSAGRFVTITAPVEELVDGTANATGTANTSIIVAQGAGFRIYLTSLIISNESAVDTAVLIKSATTTKLRVPAPQTGGAVISFDPPIRLGDNEALQFASAAAATTMHVSASGFKGR